MKFSLLALDYDGTIARDGVLDPEVRAAIMEVQAQGIMVVIVSGRILSDLEQAAGDLGFVEAVDGVRAGQRSLGVTSVISHIHSQPSFGKGMICLQTSTYPDDRCPAGSRALLRWCGDLA